MARLNLIIDPSDFAPILKPFVKTRRRLLLTTLLTTLLALGIGFGVIYYILNISSHPTLNILLILLVTFLILPAALFQTILVGDFFFSKGWRHTTFVDTETPSTIIRDHNLEFTILFGLLFVGGALLLNFSGGNFISTYNEETFFYVKSRDPDPKVRQWTLNQLASPFRYSSWKRERIRTLILNSLKDPSPKVQATACYLIGLIGISQGREALLEILRKDADPEVKEAAAIALPKLGVSDDVRLALESIVTDESQDPQAVIGALRGVARINSPLSSELVLERAKSSLGSEVGRNALYALRTLPSEKTAKWAREALKENDDFEIQCQLYDLLKFAGKTEDVSWARIPFLSPFPESWEKACPEVIWEEVDETKHYLSYGDRIPVKLVKIVANSAGGEQRAWFERLIRDKNQPDDVREIAGQVLKALVD